MAERRGGRPKGLPKTGGRKPGVKNHVNEDLRALCQTYTREGVETLASIMRASESDNARVTAVREIFERGWGKSAMAPEDADKIDGVAAILAAVWARRKPADAA